MLPEGCTPDDGDSCQSSRGKIFNPNISSTWSEIGLFTLGLYEEKPLGYEGNGRFGYDDVRLSPDASSPALATHQVIEGIATKDFYAGTIGLSGNAVNITSFQNTTDSFLTSLKTKNTIPSISWGYTAGVSTAEPAAFGSLTFGGYDASRFERNSVSFPFGPDVGREFVVYLHSIDSNGSTDPLLTTGAFMNLNSLIPQIWLPETACTAFESAFNLTYNTTTNRYYINTTTHETLLTSNPVVTFTLSADRNSKLDQRVNITLPYTTFAVSSNASSSTSSSSSSSSSNRRTRFPFPLRRSENTTQNVLGRTFFQSTYLIADWERRNFSLSQAILPDLNTKENIVPIAAVEDKNKITAVNQNADGRGSRKLGTGAVAGVAVGVVALVIAALVAGWMLYRRRMAQKQKKVEEEDEYRKAELSAEEAAVKAEMEGSDSSDGGADGTIMGEKSELHSGVDSKAELVGNAGGGNELRGDVGTWKGELPGSKAVARVELPGCEGVWELPGEKTTGGRREMDGGVASHEVDGGVASHEADAGAVGAEAEGSSPALDSGVSPEQSGGEKSFSSPSRTQDQSQSQSQSEGESRWSEVSPSSPPQYQAENNVVMDTGTGSPDTLKELVERARRFSSRKR